MRGALPKVIASSVIRSTQQGESHGGVYLIDLEDGKVEQVVDWDDPSINWEGRGSERGLRGIAFYEQHILLAASDELFVYDRSFNVVTSYRNPYLRHCHEIHVEGTSLYLTSTGFDSVLEFDLQAGRFVRGHLFRLTKTKLLPKKLRGWAIPRYRLFDPNLEGGPTPADTVHLNSVWAEGGVVTTSGGRLGHLLSLDKGRVRTLSRIPYGTHNVRPYHDGILMNDTRGDRIAFYDLNRNMREWFSIPTYPEDQLEMAHVPRDHARQGFGRGLCVSSDGLLVAGSSPSTVSAYLFGSSRPVRSVNLTKDVRNAIHGLEFWPY